MEVGIGVKLARDQVVKFSGTRRKHKRQAVDKRIDEPSRSDRVRSVVGIVD